MPLVDPGIPDVFRATSFIKKEKKEKHTQRDAFEKLEKYFFRRKKETTY